MAFLRSFSQSCSHSSAPSVAHKTNHVPYTTALVIIYYSGFLSIIIPMQILCCFFAQKNTQGFDLTLMTLFLHLCSLQSVP